VLLLKNNFIRSLTYLSIIALPVSVSAESDATIDTSYHTKVTNSAWETKDIDQSFYNSPYAISLFNPKNGEDADRLLDQTYTVFGAGFAVIGVLSVMPTSFTNWESTDESLGHKWLTNVEDSPVWDRDDWYINVIGHGYFGGVYYQAARKSGYRQWDSFLYSFMMSTFYWEYGIEAFAERPSIQDVVITPVIGWAYGEWAYDTEQKIWNNGGTLFGSKFLGGTSLIVLDPIDSLGRNINALFGHDIIKAGTGFITLDQQKTGYGEQVENQVGFKMRFEYGGDDSSALPGISKDRKIDNEYTTSTVDPVDTGIIGFSLGTVYVNPDDSWGLTDGYGYQWSLGLYFTRNISARLNYSNADLRDKNTNESVGYENYGVDAQYYFNSEANLRPFITTGFGETMYNKSRDEKTLQINAGLGLHYKINNKWALQTDWRHVYTTIQATNEDQLSTSLIYRFGKGEWSL
jgi:hypothetical protein